MAVLREQYGSSPRYQMVWAGAINGLFPARRVGRRWQVQPSDVPAVAMALGLTPTTSTAA